MNFSFSELLVALEQTIYTVSEGDGSVEVCLVRTDVILQTSARFNIFTTSGDAEGKDSLCERLIFAMCISNCVWCMSS